MLPIQKLKYLYIVIVLVLAIFMGLGSFYERALTASDHHALATEAELASVRFKREISEKRYRDLSDAFGNESPNLALTVLDMKGMVLFQSREKYITNGCADSSAIDGRSFLRLCRVAGPLESFQIEVRRQAKGLMALGVFIVAGSLILFIRTVRLSVSDSLQKIATALGKTDVKSSAPLDELLKLLSHQKKSIEDFEQKITTNVRLAAIGAVTAQFQHDVGNPIHVLQIALTDTSGEPALRAAAQSAVLKLREMMNEMRDFSGSFRTKLEPLNLSDLTRLVVDEVKACHQNLLFDLEIMPQIAVRADRLALTRVLVNLLNNAVEAGAPRIKIDLLHDQEQRKAVMKISDWGCGIAPEIKPHLFGQFATFRKKTGTGLGLWHATQSTEAMNGRLEIESPGANGAATTATLVFPTCVGLG